MIQDSLARKVSLIHSKSVQTETLQQQQSRRHVSQRGVKAHRGSFVNWAQIILIQACDVPWRPSLELSPLPFFPRGML